MVTGEPAPVAKRTSGWALASMLCSIGLCPLLTLLGPLLGIRALVDIRRTGRPGRGLAIAGIAIGVAATGVWAVAAVWWHRHARVPLMAGPVAELRAGLDGDLDAFRSGFAGDGAVAGDLETGAFLGEIAARYGGVVELRQREDAESAWGAGEVSVPYLLVAERETVALDASFVVQSDRTPGLVLKWGWIAVLDPERGNLVFPESARATVEAEPSFE